MKNGSCPRHHCPEGQVFFYCVICNTLNSCNCACEAEKLLKKLIQMSTLKSPYQYVNKPRFYQKG